MDRNDYDYYYNNFTFFVENIHGLVDLTTPGCLMNGNQYDIYSHHMILIIDELVNDLYSGRGDVGNMYIMLYILYGILNYQHYRGLLRLYNILLYDVNGNIDPNLIMDTNDIDYNFLYDKITDFFYHWFNSQIEWFRDHAHRDKLYYDINQEFEIAPENKELYRKMFRLLTNKRQNVDGFIEAFFEFIPISRTILMSQTHFNIRYDQNSERKLQREWGKCMAKYYHNVRNNYQTSGDLIQNCGEMLPVNPDPGVEY